jgi:sulfur relay (sulfurtransferase) complex TusBCD TusD component (DsrE family)
MPVLLVVSPAPFGSEGPYNGFRLAEATVRSGRVSSF